MGKERIAICVSGHVRSLDEGHSTFMKQIVEPNAEHYDFDFFFSTWDEVEWRGSDAGTKLPGSKVEDITRLFDPVSLQVELPREWDTSPYHKFIKQGYVKKGTAGEHIPAMFYKIWAADNLRVEHQKKAGFVYDVVMRWRTDFAFDENVVLDEMITAPCSMNWIVTPRSVAAPTDGPVWMSDVFAVSSDAGMQIYADAYRSLDKRVKSLGMFRPEPLLRHHLDRECVKVVTIKTPWRILRS